MRIRLFARGSLGARCAYFPIIGAGGMSREPRCLGPECHADHGRVNASRTLPAVDFDLYKTPGQTVDQRCHWMILCAAVFDFCCVFYITVA